MPAYRGILHSGGDGHSAEWMSLVNGRGTPGVFPKNITKHHDIQRKG